MAQPQAKLDATEARLAALTPLAGGAWLTAAQDQAVARLRAMGLPGRRDEYWRYTRPDRLNSAQPTPASVFEVTDETPIFDAF
ncbi:Fe-S cluster assembly protein SufD, partial [Escherichia coli]|nr:Fe-S cluster assembly protein SufD [Escherichia coli]